jgi:DNA-binding MarR family transcriptional regulator
MPGVTAKPASAASEAWDLMAEVFGATRGRFFALAREFELSPPQVAAITRLEPDRPLPMSELAGMLHCDNSNVTGIVDRLEDRGLVERRPAEHDRRVKLLALTDEGESVRAQLKERMSDPPAAIARLSAQDARALRDILRRALA